MASKSSAVAGQFLRALALRLNMKGAAPLTAPLHIAGEENAMTNIPSCSFGSEPKWHCKNDTDLLNLFNNKFPIPQSSWTVFHPTNAIFTRVLSVLRMQDTTTEEWTQSPRAGKHIGAIGAPMLHLLEWALGYRTRPSKPKPDASQVLQEFRGQDTTVGENTSKLGQFLQRSRPLARRSLWPIP